MRRLMESLRSFWAFTWTLLRGIPAAIRHEAQGFRTSQGGQIGLGPVMMVVSGIVTFIVVLLIFSAFAGTMFGAVEQITQNVTGVDAAGNATGSTTGSTEVDGLRPVFAILIAIGFLLALVTAILGAASYLNFRRN